MLKTLGTIVRGTAAAAEDDLKDRSAMLILDQQIREVAAAVEAGKRSLAVAMIHRDAEARRLARLDAALDDLEARAVAALRGGRGDLAQDAATAILATEADRNAMRGTHASFAAEVAALQQVHADATRRFEALQRGRAVAQAGEAVRRLRAGGHHSGPATASSLADAEATLARLRTRQAGDAAVEAAVGCVERSTSGMSAADAAARLGDAGFGPRDTPALGDVMARLAAKAGTAAPTRDA